MTRVLERMRQETRLLEMLVATGDDAPSLEEKCQILADIRNGSPEENHRFDQFLLGKADHLSKALKTAQSNLNKIKEILDRLTATPWTTAIFLKAAETTIGQRAMVCQGNARRVVNVTEDVDLDSLEPGDEVFLNGEMSAVVAKSHDRGVCAGETAVFDRHTDDGRLVLRSRDEELIVDVAGPLSRTILESGDQVLWDRTVWMGFERIARAEGQQYLLGEVPDTPRSRVGGQYHSLKTLLDLMTARLVDPIAAAYYEQDDGKQSALLVGPPGCGKTLMVRVACAELVRRTGKQCRFAVVKPAEWWSQFVGVTEQNIRNCFLALDRAAKESGMAVLFLDEIESIGRMRGSAMGQHSDRFLTAFLAEVDGFRDRGDVAIMAATNRKDLCDPALLDRFDLVIPVERPDMRGAREIFEVHLPESMPYSPNGEAASSTRHDLIDRAVSQLYSPNGDNSLCTIRFRDGKEHVVTARELVSGRSIEQICKAAARKAYLRYVDTREHGVRAEDIDQAVSETIERWSTTLTPHNARAYLSNLPQDIDVVAVEPVTRRVNGYHQYVNVN